MKHVLHVIESLVEGGTERSLVDLLPGLSANGYRSTLVLLFRREGLEERARDSGAEVLHLPRPGFAHWTLDLCQLIRARSPDLVHSALFRSNIVARCATAATAPPLLTSLVNAPYGASRLRRNARGLKFWAARRLDAWSGRHLTTHFHAVSESVKREAIKHLNLPSERITVVPRGRDRGRLGNPSECRRREVRERLGLGASDLVLVNVGRQEEQKGQRYLLAAATRIAVPGARVVTLVIGRRGAASSELDRLHKQLHLEGGVRLMGHRDDVPDLLAAADVFVSPTLWEGMPGAILEAMAMGLPVVASDIPSVREVVERDRTALLVPAGNEVALADTICRLLGDPALMSRLGASGRERYEENFTLEASLQGHLALYDRLVEDHWARQRPQSH